MGRAVDAAWAALAEVVDPETGTGIVDLGLVHAVEEVPGGSLRVRLTMTSAACPMAEMIVDDAHDALAGALPAGTAVEVQLVWEPPWTPARMSPSARAALGWEP